MTVCVFSRLKQAYTVQDANLGALCLPPPPAAVAEAQVVGNKPLVRNTVHKKLLRAEKMGQRESSPLLTVPRERTKQVLMNSGPKSGGVARKHLGRREVIQRDLQKRSGMRQRVGVP